MFELERDGILEYCADLEVLSNVMHDFFRDELYDEKLAEYGFNLGSTVVFIFQVNDSGSIDLVVDVRYISSLVDIDRYMEDVYGLDKSGMEIAYTGRDNDHHGYFKQVVAYRGLDNTYIKSLWGYLCIRRGSVDRDEIIGNLLDGVMDMTGEIPVYLDFFIRLYKNDIHIVHSNNIEHLCLVSKDFGILQSVCLQLNKYGLDTEFDTDVNGYRLRILNLSKGKKLGLLHLGYTNVDMCEVLKH